MVKQLEAMQQGRYDSLITREFKTPGWVRREVKTNREDEVSLQLLRKPDTYKYTHIRVKDGIATYGHSPGL